LQADKVKVVRLWRRLGKAERFYVMVKRVEEESGTRLAQACPLDPSQTAGLRGLWRDLFLVRVFVMVMVELLKVEEELGTRPAQACPRDPTRRAGLWGLRRVRVLVRVFVMVMVGLLAPEAAAEF
jgi:hypothetical protein